MPGKDTMVDAIMLILPRSWQLLGLKSFMVLDMQMYNLTLDHKQIARYF